MDTRPPPYINTPPETHNHTYIHFHTNNLPDTCSRYHNDRLHIPPAPVSVLVQKPWDFSPELCCQGRGPGKIQYIHKSIVLNLLISILSMCIMSFAGDRSFHTHASHLQEPVRSYMGIVVEVVVGVLTIPRQKKHELIIHRTPHFNSGYERSLTRTVIYIGACVCGHRFQGET